jgi:hypothetical protein
MLGSDIERYFKEHPLLRAHFLGVFAADQVHRLKLRNRTAAVVNTDSLEGDGKHWWCLLRLEGKLELFDSLGVSPAEIDERLGRNCYFNSSPVQSDQSILCGQFCLYFVRALKVFSRADNPALFIF